MFKLANTSLSAIITKLKFSKKLDNNWKLMFMDIPTELRNMIYDCVLSAAPPLEQFNKPSKYDTVFDRSEPLMTLTLGCRLIPKPFSNSDAKLHEVSSLLQTNQQVFAELMPLVEKKARVYLPIAQTLEFNALLRQVNAQGSEAMEPFGLTYLHALRSFANLHIHFHNGFRVPMPAQWPWRVDTGFRIAERLNQTLKIYTAASSEVASCLNGEKRKVVVHLDHYFQGIDAVHNFVMRRIRRRGSLRNSSLNTKGNLNKVGRHVQQGFLQG
ncbi:hypothetical protein BU23DRAFT_57981 [Bimuria novae-zelandiae CBS 107.79]|uniref:F-box domain-containing protein n=1 Tax=Bimuria novae-zelandiae CBS 107.79 TaxID=1447943 RepID=A0A6A5VFY0_9PLEO|nr:hypothetical protein BU23DRAFT_57981 [Bimuria novae-zelandiae CBS 107.79]